MKELNVKVTTSIPRDQWKIAVMGDHRWNEYLLVGIKILNNLTIKDKKKEEIQAKIRENEAEILILSQKLEEITQNEEKDAKKFKGRIMVGGE